MIITPIKLDFWKEGVTIKISTRAGVRETVERYNLQTKKKLGQHFLVDERVLEKILAAANVGKDDIVLEVGPGIGGLTQGLAERAKHVIAVELDKQLIPVLEDVFSDAPVTVVQGDILRINLAEILAPFMQGSSSGVKVVANLPYYITTPVILYMLESGLNFDSITVMVQKEVAQRMAAKPSTKEYGSLSLAVQFYADVEIVAYVPVNCFMPRPGVDSAVAHLKLHGRNISTDNGTDSSSILSGTTVDKEWVFKIIHASFNQRRKTLVNALDSAGIGEGKAALAEILQSIGMNPQVRGETLNLQQFVTLAEALKT